MAFEGSADVVGLLADRVGYGVFGDHGGAQQAGAAHPDGHVQPEHPTVRATARLPASST